MIKKRTDIMGDDAVYVLYSAIMWAVLTVIMSNLMFHG